MQRKRFTAEFKAKVALEALRSEKAVNELAGAYDVHPNQVSNWKREARAGLVEIFSSKRGCQAAHEVAERERLYSQIGRLQVELDWLKKKSGLSR
jgi:transposase